MHCVSRRHLLAGFAMIPATAYAAREPIVLVSPSVDSVISLDVINAKVGGHFTAQGLDAAIIASSTGVGAMQQLVAGRSQFLRAAAIDMVRAMARQDLKLVVIGNPEHTVSYVLLSVPERPISHAGMLRGKRIGVNSIGSTTDGYLDMMLHHAGLPGDAVERQVVGAGIGTFALVRAGKLDAVILQYERAWSLMRTVEGAPAPDVVVLRIGDVVKMPGRCYITTRTIVEQRPELAAAFMRAMAASVLELIAGPIEPLIARCAAAFDMPSLGPMAESVAIMNWIMRSWLDDGRSELLRNSDAAWRSGFAAMADAGLASGLSAGALYTNRFVEQALPR
jgi:ABC-type nitrate/sulfonate/bicarbonate transport system substrate-binding protein